MSVPKLRMRAGSAVCCAMGWPLVVDVTPVCAHAELAAKAAANAMAIDTPERFTAPSEALSDVHYGGDGSSKLGESHPRWNFRDDPDVAGEELGTAARDFCP